MIIIPHFNCSFFSFCPALICVFHALFLFFVLALIWSIERITTTRLTLNVSVGRPTLLLRNISAFPTVVVSGEEIAIRKRSRWGGVGGGRGGGGGGGGGGAAARWCVSILSHFVFSECSRNLILWQRHISHLIYLSQTHRKQASKSMHKIIQSYINT